MKTEFNGDILSVRDVEDCIRITRKYTKGVFRKSVDYPIQGEEFPSKVLTEYYEVYPDLDLDLNMGLPEAWVKFWAWVWGNVVHIDIFFHYNYITNRAKVTIYGNDGVIEALANGIPGLEEALTKVLASNTNDQKAK